MSHNPAEEPQIGEIRTILVPTDFSGIANEAFDSARMLAEKFGARVIAAHVWEDRISGLVGDYPSIGDLKTTIELQKKRARKRLVDVAATHLPGDVEVEHCVAVGVPHAEITRLADEKEVDLIVMANHGRGFISHLLLGSTTEQVIRRSSCPVLVVRRRHHA